MSLVKVRLRATYLFVMIVVAIIMIVLHLLFVGSWMLGSIS